MSSKHSHRPSTLDLATVSPSESPAILKTLPSLKDENTSIGTNLTPTNDDTAQRKIQPQSGILLVSLHEGVGISLPEHYQQLLNGRTDQQSIEPEVGTSKRPTNRVYALLDFDKSQILVHNSSGTVENPLWNGHLYKFDVSYLTELSVYLYLRNVLSTPASGRIQDICLGIARFSPRFEESHNSIEDPNIAELTIAELNQQDTVSYQKWLEVKHGTGKIRISVEFSENKTQLLQMQDFDILQILGKGRSKKDILQVRKRDNGQLYALKKIQKTSIVSQAEVADAFEVEIAKSSVLSQIKNPFLVPIKFVFQSPENLCLVSAFVHGGELIELLYREQCFDIDRIRLYIAEILCALECLHEFNIIYGNLKPQNILLDYSGHISIYDFRLCKLDTKDNIDKSCETPYLAPEIYLGQAYTEVVDWWTLGILLAEMLTGFEPSWYDEKITGMNSKIESFYFPDRDVVPPLALAQDISTKLFNCDPEQRLGAKGVAEIKAHPFFDDIDWHKILQREYEPIFKPNDAHMLLDTYPQDLDFPRMTMEEGQKLSHEMIEQTRHMFVGWSYSDPDGIVRVVGDMKAKEDTPDLISGPPAT